MKNKGFTLVEILVVIGIIGIILAFLVPNALKAVDTANTKACAANIRSIDTATQVYYSANRAWPTSIDALCPQYLPAESCTGSVFNVKCPITGVLYALSTDKKSASRSTHFLGANSSYPDKHD